MFADVEVIGGEPAEAVVEADDLEAAVDRFDGRGADDGIDARRGSAADDDSESLLSHESSLGLVLARRRACSRGDRVPAV